MFILDAPFISHTLLKTLDKQGFSVLYNKYLKELNTSKYNLKFLDEEIAINTINKNPDELLYSNSENAIDWILNNLPNSNAAINIKLFKNKTKFRDILAKIYPDFYYKEVELNSLSSINPDELVFPFVIKPVIGFLSFGVYTVKNKEEWVSVLNQLTCEIEKFANVFPTSVVNSSKFLIEELIDGEEYAVDVYFSNKQEPVILNIFKHPFLNEKDVSDRIYITSKEIIEHNLSEFNDLLKKIGALTNLKNFPMHIELRKTQKGEIIPIEVNPLRFAGWCTTDMAIHAYGINVYEHFANQTKPDWNSILKNNDGKICYFAMAEVPNNIEKNNIKNFNYDAFLSNFSEIYELRKIDYRTKPLFAIIFGRCKNINEVNKILALKTADYIQY